MIFPRVHYAVAEFRGGAPVRPPLNTPLLGFDVVLDLVTVTEISLAIRQLRNPHYKK